MGMFDTFNFSSLISWRNVGNRKDYTTIQEYLDSVGIDTFDIDYQTKDLDRCMTPYLLQDVDGKPTLFETVTMFEWEPKFDTTSRLFPNPKEETKKDTQTFFCFSGKLTVYESLHIDEGLLDVWLQFDLTFEDGVLIATHVNSNTHLTDNAVRKAIEEDFRNQLTMYTPKNNEQRILELEAKVIALELDVALLKRTALNTPSQPLPWITQPHYAPDYSTPTITCSTLQND